MLNRRKFIEKTTLAGIAMGGLPLLSQSTPTEEHPADKLFHPYAIAMWDFSWLERRWIGGGYEDWNKALDELEERGYNAVRIDAYPHLVSENPAKIWELIPVWNQNDWGAPAMVKVQVLPSLIEFIQKCGERKIKVALSTWWRQDKQKTYMKVTDAASLASVWKQTLDLLAKEDLLKHILYVDLSNEFALKVWTPFLQKSIKRNSDEGKKWMSQSIALLRQQYPSIPYTFSITSEFDTFTSEDVSYFSFLELHIWMTSFSEFYKQVGYNYERFKTTGYANLVAKGEALYLSKPDYWKQKLRKGVKLGVEWSKLSGKPLMSTEGWAVVDYKDWPMLNWDWVKELCEIGVAEAALSGRWVALCTSNFCGPQFKGMWNDVAWHKKHTKMIKTSPVHKDLEHFFKG